MLKTTKASLKKADNALLELSVALREQGDRAASNVERMQASFQETKYSIENLPKTVWGGKIPGKGSLLTTKEAKLPALLNTVICERIVSLADDLRSDVDFGEEATKERIRPIYDLVNDLSGIAKVQMKIAEGQDVKTHYKSFGIFKKKFGTKIDDLEKELIRREGEVLTVREEITAKDLEEKKRKEKEKRLEVLILSIGDEKKAELGGVMTLSNLYLAIRDRMADIGIDEVLAAAERLASQGAISGVSDVEEIKVVEFVPVSFSGDEATIFKLAEEKGFVSLEDVLIKTKWDKPRAERVLGELVKTRIARHTKSLDEGERWYFPALYGK